MSTLNLIIIIMKTFIRHILILVLLTGITLPAFSVTKDEMEKARAITAKIYLRWSNNGSGYLDDISVSSVTELEKKLREKEKANLVAFKSISVPSDYESWDKSQLVEYWSKKALNTPGLNKDGVTPGSRSRIKSAINAMSVTPPSVAHQQATPAPEAPEEVQPVPVVDTPAVAETPVGEELAVDEEELQMTEDSMLASDTEPQETIKKKSSSTWIYVVALIILVIAVVLLVVFASRSLGKANDTKEKEVSEEEKPERRIRKEATKEKLPARRAADNEESDDTLLRIREKYAENLAAKQEEIRMLTNEVMSLREENQRLAADNEHYRAEAERLRREKSNDDIERTPLSGAERREERREAAAKPETREIYLGRVNANGVFVRADRTFNPRHSIYKLRTSDGFTGTYRVVDDQSVVDLTFENPQEMLGGGCISMDITNIRGKEEIITESAGTAIFENNCWRVIRKAKIRYE